jgi:hypothetical protein
MLADAEFGDEEAKAIESAAHEAHNRAQEMTATPARSVRGLAAKAREFCHGSTRSRRS